MFDYTIKADATQALQTSKDVEASLERVLKKNEALGESFAKQARASAAAESSRLAAARSRAADLDAQLSSMRGFEGLATALKREADILERLRGPMREHRNGVEAISAMYKRGAISMSEYNRELDRLNATIGRTPKAGVGAGVIQGLGGGMLAGGAAGVAAAATQAGVGAVKDALELADAYTNLDNRLKRVTSTEEERAALMSKTHELANNARMDWSATGETFVRLTNATKDMGLSQRNVLDMTGSLSKALSMQGMSSAEASSTMLQLTQAFSSGKLAGDEFRTVAEAFPELLTMIAKEMHVSRGALKQMASDGLITSDVLARTLTANKNAIDEGFAKTAPTLSQSWTVFKNDMMEVAGETVKSTDILKTLAGAFRDLATAISAAADAYKALKSAKDTISELLPSGGGLTDMIPVVTPGKLRDASASGANPDQIQAANEEFAGSGFHVGNAQRAQYQAIIALWTDMTKKVESEVTKQAKVIEQQTTDMGGNAKKLFGETESVVRSGGVEVVHTAGAIEDAGRKIFDTFAMIGEGAKATFLDSLPASIDGSISKLGDMHTALLGVSDLLSNSALGDFVRKALGGSTGTGIMQLGKSDAEIAAAMAKKSGTGPKGKPIKDALVDGTHRANMSSLAELEAYVDAVQAVDAAEASMSAGNIWTTLFNPEQVAIAEKIAALLFTHVDLTKKWNEELRMINAQQTPFQKGISDGLEAIKTQMMDVDGAIKGAMTSSFSSLEDGILDLVDTGEANFDRFFDSITKGLAKVALKILEMRLLMAVFGGGTPSVFGTGASQAFSGLFGGAHADGGAYTVPGSGPPDSQNVMFRLTPGETVHFTPPGGGQGGQGGGAVVHNHWDRRELLASLNTPEGRQVVHNIVRADPGAFRQVLRK